MVRWFTMPQATPTLTVGVIGKLAVGEGTKLTPGTVIAAVETDKATMDIEVFENAYLRKWVAAEGAEVPVGAPIAILADSLDEDITGLKAPEAPKPAPAAAPPSAPVVAPVEAAPVAAPPVVAPAPEPKPEPGVVAPPRWASHAVDDSIMEPRGVYAPPARRLFVSPLARARAAELGVPLQRLRGSGPGGRIVAADVVAPAPGPAPAQDEAVRVTQMRKTIARRLTEVHQQVPVFYLTTSFDGTAFTKLKAAAAARDVKVSLNDLLVKAVAAALRDVPEVNAQWTGESIVRKGAIDIGVAVALPEGLITPVLRGVDQLSVRELGSQLRELATRAKAGKLTPEEYTGSTFTISNLGMFEIEHFTAILNPPEAAILAVGAAQEVAVVVDGVVRAQTRFKVTMTCDHRVIDGALGARFLSALRAHVENPGLALL